jgi:hypothetical protein
MRLEVSQKSFDIMKSILSGMYLELIYQRDHIKELSYKRKDLSDTAELVRDALKEIGVIVSPTKNDVEGKAK